MENYVVAYSLKSEKTQILSEQIRDSKIGADFCRQLFDIDTLELYESMWAVYLDAKQRVKGFLKISEGGINCTICDPKKVYMGALACVASAIIITHNHPSGSTQPSSEDKQLTKKLYTAAKLLDISFVDHVIITDKGYYSFRENGLLDY